MPTYTVVVTVQLYAENEPEAHSFIKTALRQARIAEVVYQDSEIIETESDSPDLPIYLTGKD